MRSFIGVVAIRRRTAVTVSIVFSIRVVKVSIPSVIPKPPIWKMRFLLKIIFDTPAKKAKGMANMHRTANG
jgi:hypothetical protein